MLVSGRVPGMLGHKVHLGTCQNTRSQWIMKLARKGHLLNSDSIIFPQGGPPSSYKWGEITPISRGEITPVTNLFSAIYRGPITLFITCRGPPCTFYRGLEQDLRYIPPVENSHIKYSAPLKYRIHWIYPPPSNSGK